MRKSVFLIMALLLCLTGAVFAQDATLEPTAEVTPVVTVETTPEATMEATPESTVEATDAPVETATPEMTAAPTMETTAEAVPDMRMGMTGTFCGTLAEADCAILNQSHTAMQTLDSASVDMTLLLTISGVPDLPSPSTITLSGTGSYSGLNAIRAIDMTTMASDPGSMVTSALKSFSGDLSLTLTIPPALAAEMGDDAPNSLTLKLRLVDGIGYINFDTLQPIINDPSLSGWGGLDLVGLLNGVMTQYGSELQMGMADMMANANPMDPSMYSQFSSPDFINQIISVRRIDNGANDIANFEFRINFGALMSSPEFRQLLRQEMEAQMDVQGATLSEQEMDQMMGMLSQVYAGMTFLIREQISTTDGFVRSINASFNFDAANLMNSLSSMDMMGANGAMMDVTPEVGSMMQPAPSVRVNLLINFSDFNAAPEITAPEDAAILPYQMLLGMMNGALMQPMATTPAPTVEGIPATDEAAAAPTMEATAAPTVEATAAPATEEPTGEFTVEPQPIPTLDLTPELNG